MIASRITIFWKLYKPQYPTLLAPDLYDYYKSASTNKLPTIRFKFLEEFYIEIIFISVGVLFLIADTYHWYLRGGLMELLGVLFFIIAIVMSLSFILSAISFTACYFKSKRYIDQLNKSIKNSNSYQDFCQSMSKIDNSYLMQIQRLSNESK